MAAVSGLRAWSRRWEADTEGVDDSGLQHSARKREWYGKAEWRGVQRGDGLGSCTSIE